MEKSQNQKLYEFVRDMVRRTPKWEAIQYPGLAPNCLNTLFELRGKVKSLMGSKLGRLDRVIDNRKRDVN